MRLQTVLFPSEEVCAVKELYFHKAEKEIKYDGYFNIFSVSKWKNYAGLENLKLHLRVTGFAEVTIMCNEEELVNYSLEAEKEKSYTFAVPIHHAEGVIWFVLKQENDKAEFFEGSYETEDVCRNDIGLGVVICTFRREEYIKKNLKILEKAFENNKNLEAGKRLQIYIVDNGRTLDEIGEERSYIHVIPNKNVGGAGGFTRGLIQTEKDGEKYHLSHVIFMDDDIVIEPDALIRTYALLSLLKTEYRDKGIGGANLRLDFPYIQHASGEDWNHGGIISEKQGLDLRSFQQCMENEKGSTAVYNGWWYCCMPLSWAGTDNLPFPMFVHTDDVEYGVRNQKHGFLYLNGIAVWHSGIENRKPSSFEYYETRNGLILRAVHSSETGVGAIKKWILKRTAVNILRYRYEDVKMTYKGVEDFCKGVNWLADENGAELHKTIIRDSMVMKPLSQWTKEKAVLKQAESYVLSEDGTDIYSNAKQAKQRNAKILLTLNGWLLPARRKSLYALPMGASPFEFYRKKRVLLFEPETNKGILVQKSYMECIKSLVCCWKAWRILDKYYLKSAQDYRMNGHKITNLEFWEKYLEI